MFFQNFTRYLYTEGHKIKRGCCFSTTQFPVWGYTVNNQSDAVGGVYIFWGVGGGRQVAYEVIISIFLLRDHIFKSTTLNSP